MFEEYLPIIIVVLFGAVTLIELAYYYLVYARFSFARKKNSGSQESVPVSVVLVVKDAAGTLLKTLPRFLNQQYPQFEVVVVDDNSRDETPLLIKEYQQQYPNLKLVNLDSAVTTIRGRKFAISMGIRCASYDHLLFSDPECAPSSAHWLERMAANFSDKKKIILGYSTYEKRNNPFNRMLHFDTLINAVQFFSLASIRSTYRGDGKNMAYTKDLFTKQRGFASHNHISFGEEDIFISRAATKSNTTIEYSQDAFTVLQRSANHSYWKAHKMGLYFTRKYNTKKNAFLLNTYAIVNLLFYAALALAIVLTLGTPMLLYIVLGITFVRVVSQYFVFGFAAKKLNEKQIIPALLLYDIIFAVLNPLYFISAKLSSHKYL